MRKHTKQVIILVSVDDLLIIRDDIGHIQEVKDVLYATFKIKDLGPLKYFLGIEVCMSQRGILLCQRKYTIKLIAELGLTGYKPEITPLEKNHKLTSLEYDQQCGIQDDPSISDVRGYQRLIGKLVYLTLTRPHISYSMQTLSLCRIPKDHI